MLNNKDSNINTIVVTNIGKLEVGVTFKSSFQRLKKI